MLKSISLWLAKQPSPHTRGCYRRDSERLLEHAKKPLASITLADLQSFAQTLGFNHGRWTPLVQLLSVWIAAVIAGLNVLLALSVQLRLIEPTG